MPLTVQYQFHHAHYEHPCANIGCDEDSSGLGKRGAVNVDIWKHNSYTNRDVPAEVIADARNLPFEEMTYASVILGDILEHFVKESDIHQVLREAWRVLQPGAKVIITCPTDTRPPELQGYQGTAPMYCDGVRAYHAYPVRLETMRSWLKDCGLPWRIVDEQFIAYCWCPQGGWGIAATKLVSPEELERFFQRKEANRAST